MRVLLVEDEADVRELMSVHLKRERLDVVTASNGKEALKIFAENQGAQKFSLIVLDWMLPGVSGIDLCKTMAGSAPILMVTARSEPADIVLGLETGADDYITKPFEIPVFTARVRALLRRNALLTEGRKSDVYKIGDLEVDAGKAEVKCGGKEIKLTASEFKLLVAMVQSQGKVLPREKLLSYIQEEGTIVVDRVIDTHVYGLRGKIGACSEVIETVRGIGYRVKAG